MGTAVLKTTVKKGVLSLALLALLPGAAMADKTDDIVNRGVARTKAGAASQKRIDDIADKTDKIISQYHQQRKVVEGLKIYNDRLRRTLTAQEVAMSKLEKSIEDASLIERQIVPLMLRMIDGLEQFVALDLPFKMDERNARIERIKGYLTNANISAAERFRQVLDAYSIENGYGTTIAVYSDVLKVNDEDLNVNILQVGRTGLYYQTLDATRSGYWDKDARQWVELDSSHNEGILRSIRITQGKESKDLMEIPLASPVVAGGA